MEYIKPSMLIISSTWGPPGKEKDTFRLIPVTLDCPYAECIFDPGSRVLAVISKIPTQKFVMVPKLDDNGNTQKKKNEPGNKEERKIMDTFIEYYVEHPEEIRTMILQFAVNKVEWIDRVEEYLKVPVAPPGAISITPGGLKKVEDEVNPEKVNQ